MGDDTSHLLQKTAEYLARTDQERIAYIRSPRWIGYPRAQKVLKQLETLLSYPASHRMPNLLISALLSMVRWSMRYIQSSNCTCQTRPSTGRARV